MAKTRFDYDILDCPAEAPIVFTGPPGRLSARLPVRNVGADRAVLRHATVRAGELGETAASVGTIVLRPEMSANLRARISVPPSTPPGDYPCEVEIGGSTRPALLRISEVVDVALSPDVLFIENTPGTRITKRVLVHNRGNVPITVGHPGGIALDDERGECRVTRATYEALGRALEGGREKGSEKGSEDGSEPELTFERAFGEWVRQGREHLASVGVLGVRNAAGSTAIEGGEQVAVEFNVRVPAGLDQHTRYIGSFPLYDADLVFIVVPGPGAGDDAPKEEAE